MKRIGKMIRSLFPSNKYGWMTLLFFLLLLPNLVVMFRSSDLAGDIPKQVAYLFFSCLILTVPALLFKARVYFALSSLFLILSPIEIGHVILNKMPISIGLMSAILHTNNQEAFELIYSSFYPDPYPLLLGIVHPDREQTDIHRKREDSRIQPVCPFQYRPMGNNVEDVGLYRRGSLPHAGGQFEFSDEI